MVDRKSEINNIIKNAKAITISQPRKAYDMCKEAYELSLRNHFKEEAGYSLLGMSLACRAKSEINQMLEYSYSALELFEELQLPDGHVRALNLIGIAYFYNSEYEQALGYLIEAQNILNIHQDSYMLSCLLNNLGEVMRESARYEEALKFYHRALSISSEASSKINTASLLGNIGEVYFLQNKIKDALDFFMQSYNIMLEEKDDITLAEVENKIGKVHSVNHNHNEAEKFFQLALHRLENIDNKFYEIDVLINMAQLKFDTDKNATSDYLERAMQYARSTNAKKKLNVIYKTMSEYYESIHEYKDALIYYKRYHSNEKEVSISIVGNKFEAMKLELEHYNEKQDNLEVSMLNTRLELEIIRQKNELEKIQKLNEDLEEKAYLDELTGVSNRRDINNRLYQNWEDPGLRNQIISLFIIDIDNFKKYNDCWGHIEGDLCLQKVAKRMKEIQITNKDVFGGYGGEEFIYFAFNRSYDETCVLGNRLRSEIEGMNLTFMKENKPHTLTISVGGVWGRLSEFESVHEMLQCADHELYKAKTSGRNRTIIVRKSIQDSVENAE